MAHRGAELAPRSVEVIGTPTVSLRVASSHPDAAILVYLEDVDEKGQSRYLTEGGLRRLELRRERQLRQSLASEANAWTLTVGVFERHASQPPGIRSHEPHVRVRLHEPVTRG